MIWSGWSYLTLGQPERVVTILERGMRLHPRRYRLLSALTDCYASMGHKDDERRLLARGREVLMDVLTRELDDVYARRMFGGS